MLTNVGPSLSIVKNACLHQKVKKSSDKNSNCKAHSAHEVIKCYHDLEPLIQEQLSHTLATLENLFDE